MKKIKSLRPKIKFLDSEVCSSSLLERETMSLGKQILHGIYDGVSAGTSSLLHGVYDDQVGDVDRAVVHSYYRDGRLVADKFDRSMISAADKQKAALTPPVPAEPVPSVGTPPAPPAE